MTKRALALRKNVYRWGYYFAMFSGLRALTNRAIHRSSPLDSLLQELHEQRLCAEGLGEFLLYVHPRSRNCSLPGQRQHGVFSLVPIQPNVPRWAHHYFRTTSHFGSGYVEIAFYWSQERLTLYGVRNIAHANAHRLGFVNLAERLRSSANREEQRLLLCLSCALREKGIQHEQAPAEECFQLTVDPRLVPPGQEDRFRRTFLNKYRKMGFALSTPGLEAGRS